MEAVLKISDNLKMNAAAFLYAGVKDKRAKTTQWCSVRRLEPWKLITRVNSERNIKVGNLTFKNEPLTLGQLKGNQFKIALRNVLANDDLIEKSMKFIEENGFINYYGLQRFGNDKEVPTYMIGINLLLGKFKEVKIVYFIINLHDRYYFTISFWHISKGVIGIPHWKEKDVYFSSIAVVRYTFQGIF